MAPYLKFLLAGVVAAKVVKENKFLKASGASVPRECKPVDSEAKAKTCGTDDTAHKHGFSATIGTATEYMCCADDNDNPCFLNLSVKAAQNTALKGGTTQLAGEPLKGVTEATDAGGKLFLIDDLYKSDTGVPCSKVGGGYCPGC